ncbi:MULTISPECIES: Gfo/Idh/MocA family protein [Mesobacillus]|uniref:Lipopolysaccharide biosynthesis protein n=2 Tax=Mesobacillus TaxID=2675231 RepID=A0A0D6ZCU3_9BACI|nr:MULTISPECIES: Gfo/Idh/MocA family oxidoreductase [Mesobacillus]KIY23110.1 lipopolysaccharide biosynthesis protein [Mesobacillus subterraneus]MDQ0415302.1 putative dehydrogenase [Mesobacillus stamsii]
MNKLKVGVIGCGRISVVYAEAFKRLSNIEVKYALDIDLRRAEKFAMNFSGCEYSDSIEDLLQKNLDVVHVLSPHYLHREHVIQCLEAGFNVLTEKPIATTLEDGRAMAETAKNTGKKLGVIFQNRYIDGIIEAKKLIDQGAFGKITGAWSSLNWHRPPSYYQIEWKGSWEKEGGGVVIDQAIHSIDLVRYLVGSEVKSIKAQIDTRVLTQIEVEDVASAAITFENGVIYSFFACNYFTSNSPIRIELSAENGSILLEGEKVTIRLNGKELIIHPTAEIKGEGETYWSNYHTSQLKHYYQCLLNDKPVPVSPDDAIKTLEVVLGIYESAKRMSRVSMEK